tara:strand:+ start:322 stop:531 length:210 start_codon:yes stop_codon:yes gene_type:complete
MKNSRIDKALKLVDKIETIRSKNNKNWMDLLRISLKLNFEETSKILKEICKQDNDINKLAKKINNLKNK